MGGVDGDSWLREECVVKYHGVILMDGGLSGVEGGDHGAMKRGSKLMWKSASFLKNV